MTLSDSLAKENKASVATIGSGISSIGSFQLHYPIKRIAQGATVNACVEVKYIQILLSLTEEIQMNFNSHLHIIACKQFLNTLTGWVSA